MLYLSFESDIGTASPLPLDELRNENRFNRLKLDYVESRGGGAKAHFIYVIF